MVALIDLASIYTSVFLSHIFTKLSSSRFHRDPNPVLLCNGGNEKNNDYIVVTISTG